MSGQRIIRLQENIYMKSRQAGSTQAVSAAKAGIIAAAADDLGLSFKFMPSGAGHDAQDMALVTPTGMIFVPSVKRISHSPIDGGGLE